MEGFGPPTRWLQISCSGQLSYIGIFNSRTLVIISPFVAGVGFEPTSFGLWDRAGASPVHPAIFYFLAGAVGLEPTTITLTVCRSTCWAILPIYDVQESLWFLQFIVGFFQIVAVWFFISFHHLKNQEFLSFWFFRADEQNRTAISSVASWYTNHCATSAKGWIDTRLVYHYYLITVVSTVPTTLLIFSSGKSLFTICLFRNKV